MDRHRQLAMAFPVSGDVIILQIWAANGVIYKYLKAFPKHCSVNLQGILFPANEHMRY